jgi:D-serine deaminase-like pyridoxal phosphate-dependent protein
VTTHDAPATAATGAAAATAPGATAIEPPVLPPGLDTPALIIDIGIVEANARRLGDQLQARGVALRPHAKTHKSVALAQLQLAAGAAGITVGTLGEAEVMANGGIDDIFIAYPVWAVGPKAERLVALHARSDLALSVGFDSVAGAERLAVAVGSSGRPLRVVLEIDPGNGRTGVAPARAGQVAGAARDLGLDVIGVFTHGGHAYRGADAIAGAANDEVRSLGIGVDLLRTAGIEPQVISAGSTPTALGAATGPVTEIRAGTYLLGDRIQVVLGASPRDGVAIAIASTVVSIAVDGQVVIDAGAKTLTKDVPGYLTGFGSLPAYPDAILERVFDYHAVIRMPEGSRRPALGEVVTVIPNHCCVVVDLFDEFVATRAGEIVGRWPVDARGRSR